MLQASAFAHSAPSVNVIPSSAMVKESIYLCKFLVNLGHPSTAPTPVFADNETCIAWSEGSQGTVGSSECAARIDLHFHSVHEGHAAGHLKLCSLSKVNATDILTKASTHPDVFSDLGSSISCLQHYANTATSKMQVTNEEAKGAQSWKTNSAVERNIVRWNRRLDWNAWLLQTCLSSIVSNKKLENVHLFNLNMLEIWVQTIRSQMIWKDSAVFQPFCWVYNVALRGMANTVAAVLVHTRIQNLFESNILIWK